MLNLLLILVVVVLAIAPVVAIVETVGWAIGVHAFPSGSTWIVAGLGVGFWIFLRAAKRSGRFPSSSVHTSGPSTSPKRYVMRGYGGGSSTTSVHPRQQKRGKTIAYIPGVGYRHVQKRRPRSR